MGACVTCEDGYWSADCSQGLHVISVTLGKKSIIISYHAHKGITVSTLNDCVSPTVTIFEKNGLYSHMAFIILLNMKIFKCVYF